MLALFHLFCGVAAHELVGLEAVFEQTKPEVLSGVRRAVIVGNKLPPGQPHRKKDGTVVHTLWEREDKSVVIMPCNLPLDEPRLQSETTRYLPDGWDKVIEKDVDGETSLPLKMDRDKLNLGRVSACRRVARTVFLGSAPTAQAANRGVEDRRIKLGCVQPGEAPAVFGDALRHLSQAATYLYLDAGRYWYSTQPTVTKLADDRAEQLKRDPDKVNEETKRRVRLDLQSRGEFAKFHAFPAASGEVSDELEVRLVVLGVEFTHSREGESPAFEQTHKVLDARGNSPRLYKNTVVFLARSRPGAHARRRN